MSLLAQAVPSRLREHLYLICINAVMNRLPTL
jgi:hypothetical protein